MLVAEASSRIIQHKRGNLLRGPGPVLALERRRGKYCGSSHTISRVNFLSETCTLLTSSPTGACHAVKSKSIFNETGGFFYVTGLRASKNYKRGKIGRTPRSQGKLTKNVRAAGWRRGRGRGRVLILSVQYLSHKRTGCQAPANAEGFSEVFLI